MMDRVAKWRIKQAVTTLNIGGVIAYPTEAVYGLGCDPWHQQAVAQLLTIKQRPWQKGLILVAHDLAQLQPFILPLSLTTAKKLAATWPGPTTWLVPANPEIPRYLSGCHDTVAVRVTAHKQTAELCQAFGGAIISTSANLAGIKPAKTTREVRWRLAGLDYVLSGQCSGFDQPTEIRDSQTGAIIR